MDAIAKSVKHRNKVKKWFITFPRCGGIVTKGEFIEEFEKMFPCKKYLIAEEKHADGEPHLHALVELESGVAKTSLLEWCKKTYEGHEKRVDFGSVKKWDDCVAYLTIPKGKKKRDDMDSEPLSKGVNAGDEDYVMKRRHNLWRSGVDDPDPCPEEWGCKLCGENVLVITLAETEDEKRKRQEKRDESEAIGICVELHREMERYNYYKGPI